MKLLLISFWALAFEQGLFFRYYVKLRIIQNRKGV